ncbi:muscarinic acetylcholine receptor M2-like, partial [Temnothorax curvispinosus]|uniref:Muscarinic acetylcholine receptor M2-like n=1 Tax=Temnothorax curvispinosus TaxID=300111 RepID=A0A6J1RMZ5_9HYME
EREKETKRERKRERERTRDNSSDMNVTLTVELPGNDSYNVSTNGLDCDRQPIPYTGWEGTLIVVIATFLCLITAIGNMICLLAIMIDKKLQKFSNYFVFSLAIADFAVGLISMPVFTLYKVLGYWPLGPRVCDTWLSLDYLLSNASVLNILIISMDRYVSVTRPFAYQANRTTTKAAIMIGEYLIIGEVREFSENFVETRETLTFVEIVSLKILFFICDLKLLQFSLTKFK